MLSSLFYGANRREIKLETNLEHSPKLRTFRSVLGRNPLAPEIGGYPALAVDYRRPKPAADSTSPEAPSPEEKKKKKTDLQRPCSQAQFHSHHDTGTEVLKV